MKTLFLKYMLLGLWLMCYIPFKRALVLSSQTTVITSTQAQQPTLAGTSPIRDIIPFENQMITSTHIKAAYLDHDLLPKYADSPMIYLDSWNRPSTTLHWRSSAASVVDMRHQYSTYLLRLSSHKSQQFLILRTSLPSESL